MMKTILCGMLLWCSALVHASDKFDILVDKNQPNFVVQLPANPTTGYQWQVLQYNKKLLTLSSSIYQNPKSNLIGAGGMMLYTFTLNAGKVYPEKTHMMFKYSRPWAPQQSSRIQKVVIRFK